MKNKTTALILSILVGGLGVDRFYLGYTGMGVLKLLTGGCFGVLWIIDIVNIATGKLLPADGSSYEDDMAKKNTANSEVQDSFANLEKAAKLHEQGTLSDEEYSKIKNKGRLWNEKKDTSQTDRLFVMRCTFVWPIGRMRQ